MPESAAAPLSIELEVRIDAPIARVWSLVATSPGMRRWMNAHTFEPVLGGEAVFYLNFTTGSSEPEGAEYCSRGRVVRLEPIRRIAYTWRQEDLLKGTIWPADTLVTIELRGEERDSTRVVVRHTGFETLGDLALSAYEDYRGGWEAHDDLGRLKGLAEEGVAFV